jgi:hypothetical protein
VSIFRVPTNSLFEIAKVGYSSGNSSANRSRFQVRSLCDVSGLGMRPGHLGVPISLQGIKFMSSLTLQPHAILHAICLSFGCPQIHYLKLPRWVIQAVIHRPIALRGANILARYKVHVFFDPATACINLGRDVDLD